MGVPIIVYLCMAESSVLFVSSERVMQVSSICWIGVRIGLYSGGNAEDQTDASWCWGVPGARAVRARLSWRWLIRCELSRAAYLALCLNSLVDFFAMNRHIRRGGDADSYLLPANAQHLNADVVVYADGFAYSSGKYQHGDAPWFVVPVRRAGAIRVLTGQLWHFGATHQAHFSEAPSVGRRSRGTISLPVDVWRAISPASSKQSGVMICRRIASATIAPWR